LETDADESQVDKKAFEVKRVDLTKWHEYQVIARGNRLIHRLDGKTTIDLTDNHEKALKKGVIALQVHAGPPMTVYFKDIKLTEIEAESEASKDQE
jgi:putative component of toxin-antitoxin plasmid stabilization module